MTARTRRLAGAMVVVIVFLFVARWSVSFVAERWWAATISPHAAAFVTYWQLLGLGLDAGAIVVASTWFVIQALVVARAISSVQVAHRLGDLQLREAVPTRLLVGGAVASGVLLGLIAGTGADSWRDPVLLASRGVHYGVTDPLLHVDLGVLVAQLPAWDLFQQFAALLAFLGLAFCFAVYSGIGGLRRERGSVAVHPDARRHLGVLIALAAAVIATGYLLTPYRLAAASLQWLTPASAQTRLQAAAVMTGIAAATALLSLHWALRGRNMLLVASWVVLASGALVERYVVPALAAEVRPTPGRSAEIRRFDAIAWGIREAAPLVRSADGIPAVTAIWDEPLLGRLVSRSGGLLEAATPTRVVTSDGSRAPVWLLATEPAGRPGEMDVLAVEDGAVTAAGAAILVRSPEENHTVRPIWRAVAEARTRPGAQPWRSVSGAVNGATPLRRLLLAWARQAPGMLGNQVQPDMDWHLDPTDRAAAILPMLSWSAPDLLIVAGRPTWLVQGMAVIEQFPLATRARWRDIRVAGVVPAVLCSIDVASGETHFYRDPGSDSLGTGWAQAIGPLVGPVAAIPGEIRAQLPYPVDWLEAQASVLESTAWTPDQAGPATAATAVPIWLPGGMPGHQIEVRTAGHGAILLIVTGYRSESVPQLLIERRDSSLSPGEGLDGFRRRWAVAEALLHIRDSVTAAGDTVWIRPPRWFDGGKPVGWQPIFAAPTRGEPTLLWIATGVDDQSGGGRNATEAWQSAREPAHKTEVAGPGDDAIVERAREWLQRADSALRRADMTAFGHAFEELRRALAKRP